MTGQMYHTAWENKQNWAKVTRGSAITFKDSRKQVVDS